MQILLYFYLYIKIEILKIILLMKDYLILESKDYPLYKGISDDIMLKIVESGYIIATKEFDSGIRQNITNKNVISATRNKNYAGNCGNYIIIFDTKKIFIRF
jgi:hypothetical protein